MLNFIYNRRRKRRAKMITNAALYQMIDDLSSEIYNLIGEIDEVREDLAFVMYEIDSQLEH